MMYDVGLLSSHDTLPFHCMQSILDSICRIVDHRPHRPIDDRHTAPRARGAHDGHRRCIDMGAAPYQARSRFPLLPISAARLQYVLYVYRTGDLSGVARSAISARAPYNVVRISNRPSMQPRQSLRQRDRA